MATATKKKKAEKVDEKYEAAVLELEAEIARVTDSRLKAGQELDAFDAEPLSTDTRKAAERLEARKPLAETFNELDAKLKELRAKLEDIGPAYWRHECERCVREVEDYRTQISDSYDRMTEHVKAILELRVEQDFLRSRCDILQRHYEHCRGKLDGTDDPVVEWRHDAMLASDHPYFFVDGDPQTTRVRREVAWGPGDPRNVHFKNATGDPRKTRAWMDPTLERRKKN